MSNLLRQLDNDQAILLMYLAGELPEEDRVDVEQRLVNDESLRAAMADLAALQSSIDTDLARLGDIPATRREASVRRVVRAMSAVHEERLAADTAPPEPVRTFRLSWWAYPAAAAALLLIGIIVMTNRTPNKLDPTPQMQELSFNMERDVPAVRILDQPDDPALDRLDAVEQQLLSLHTPDDGLFQIDSLDADR